MPCNDSDGGVRGLGWRARTRMAVCEDSDGAQRGHEWRARSRMAALEDSDGTEGLLCLSHRAAAVRVCLSSTAAGGAAGAGAVLLRQHMERSGCRTAAALAWCCA